VQQCNGMQPFSNSANVSCCHKNFMMMISQTVQELSRWQHTHPDMHQRGSITTKTEWRLISATLCSWRSAVSWLTNHGAWNAYEKKKIPPGAAVHHYVGIANISELLTISCCHKNCMISQMAHELLYWQTHPHRHPQTNNTETNTTLLGYCWIVVVL